jgi:ankyrin repeat protein
VDAAGEDDSTPLHAACKNGHRQVVRALLSSGASLDAVEAEDGFTPLHFASECGRSAIAKELLARGASVDAAAFNGDTPLYRACDVGQLEVVRELLKGGAAVGARNDAGRTPFYAASDSGNVELVRELLQAPGGAALAAHGLVRATIARCSVSVTDSDRFLSVIRLLEETLGLPLSEPEDFEMYW